MIENFDSYSAFTTDLAFHPLNYEHQLVLPTGNRQYLQDVELRLYGYPDFHAPNLTASPSDIRLYIDGVEITDAYIELMKEAISEKVTADAGKPDGETFKGQLKKALDGWIDMADAMGNTYPGDFASDEAERDRLLTVDPPSDLLHALGDHTVGSKGFLHVFNFLYSHIELKSISLSEVVKKVNTAAGSLVIDVESAKVLTISSGDCRLFTAGWRPPRVGGTVIFQAETRYHDPLADVVEGLKQRLEQLETELKRDLEEIFDRLGPDGEIRNSLEEVKDAIDDATATLKAMNREVESLALQVTALKSTTRDLKNAVDAL